MTYSIVARDPISGELGVAVQSHFFGVGRVVTWGQAGVGVVATQSIVEVSYGPDGLELMAQGIAPSIALQRLLDRDPGSDRRQVAFMNVDGDVATHTGTSCIGAAGHLVGHHVSAQANLVESSAVWTAMVHAFDSGSGDLASRLLTALRAAEAEGGDLRGRQSAAMLIVRGSGTGRLVDDRILDLRVDDSLDPLKELGRLIGNAQAMGGLVELLEAPGLLSGPFTADGADVAAALAQLAAAQDVLGPTNREPTVWQALLLARAGRDAEAVELFRVAAQVEPRVPILLQRLANAGMWHRSQADLDAVIAGIAANANP